MHDLVLHAFCFSVAIQYCADCTACRTTVQPHPAVRPQLYTLPEQYVAMVPITHPDIPGFASLGKNGTTKDDDAPLIVAPLAALLVAMVSAVLGTHLILQQALAHVAWLHSALGQLHCYSHGC